MALLKLSTAYTRAFFMTDSADHLAGKTGLTVTVNLSKAGGAFAAAGGTITELANGWYKIAYTTTDTNTAGDLAARCTGTGADSTDFTDQVIAADLGDAVRLGLSALANAAAGATGGLAVQAASGSVQSDVWGATRSSFTAAGTFGRSLQVIRDGTAQAGGSTSITLDAGASGTTDFYKNAIVSLIGGTGAGQSRFCTAYNGGTKVATVSAWAVNPDGTSVFVIYGFDAIPGATAPTAVQNAQATWDLATTSAVTAGSFGVLVKTDLDRTISGIWDELLANHTVTGSFGHSLQVVRTGTAQAGAASTITLDASASATDNLYNGAVIFLTSGTGAGQANEIISYNGTTKVATLRNPWVVNPSSSSVFVILPAPQGVDLGTAWDTLRSAHTVAGSFGEGVTSVQGSVTGSVASVTGAVGSVTGAVGSVTGNVGGNVVGSVASVTGSVGGNVVGSVGSVTGAVGSVTGAVGSVTGNVGGNVVGTIGGLTAGAKTDVGAGVWNEPQTGHTTAGTFGASHQIVRSATAQAGAATTITLDAAASATDNFYKGDIILLVAGTGAGQGALITGYVGATKLATISVAWVVNPAADSVFVIYATARTA